MPVVLAQSLLHYLDLSSIGTTLRSLPDLAVAWVGQHPASIYVLAAVAVIVMARAFVGRR